MKNSLIKISFIVSAFIFSFGTVFASGDDRSGGGGGKIKNPIQANDIQEFVLQILDIIIQIGVVVVVLFLLLAGLKFVTAQGNEQKISEARKTFFWTIIGALLVLGARAIAEVVARTAKELQGFYQFGVPVFGMVRSVGIKNIFSKKDESKK